MMKMRNRVIWGLLTTVVAALRVAGQETAHFEARQVRPVALTPDGTRLLVLHGADAKLSVFDVAGEAAGRPVLTAELQTGLEPVSVMARTDDEVWVVNEASDSVSVISLKRMTTVATLVCGDEPGDVVLAGGRAWVSCGRSNEVWVYDAESRAMVGRVALPGLYPRALAVKADGSGVYVASLLSGNGTTVLPAAQAGLPPLPTNGSLPGAPATARIVRADDARVTWTVADDDVMEIGVAGTPAVVRRHAGVGTHLFAMAVQPGSGRLWVANTEALNEKRFEPELRGHFADHRLTVLEPGAGVVAVRDLNAGISYGGVLPDEAARAVALAEPHALVFEGDGAHVWVAAFGSDRVARVRAADGVVVGRVDLRAAGEGSRAMRGPRGMVGHPERPLLYVVNKVSDSVSVVDMGSGAVVHEQRSGTHHPWSAVVREGRGFLFDARLSGNGTVSCGTCHLDADNDGLAWDLGDPGGVMLTVAGANLSVHDTTPRGRVMHPMKGPMVTQTLRGMQNGAPFHWRGDRPTLQSFNPTFRELLGGSELAGADMDALAAYLLTLRHHPNPNRKADRTLPASFNGGNPVRGRDLYNLHTNHCAVCHTLPAGTDNNIDLPQEVGSVQPLKNPPLRTTYQRVHFNPRAGAVSRSGYGLGHDGTGFVLPTVHPYVLDELTTPADFADVAAFVMCFDSGTAPAACRQVTVTAASAAGAAGELSLLEGQARVANTSDLAVHGSIGGVLRRYFYDRAVQRYRPDAAGMATLSRAELIGLLSGGDDVLTFMGTLPGQGLRAGGDRDADGVPDRSEMVPEVLVREASGGGVEVSWSREAAGWVPQWAAGPGVEWAPLRLPVTVEAQMNRVVVDPPAGRGFVRLRRTW
jgi:DNA-binding beta-propeller fold protein YncE